MALERGPLVYCAEAMDNDGHALDLVLHDDADLTVEDAPALLNGIKMIHATQPGASTTEPLSPQISNSYCERSCGFRRAFIVSR